LLNSNPMSLLKQKVEKDHVVHAYLFLGSNDLRNHATQLAMSLNCLDLKAGGEACGVCANCYKISTDSHPDIYTLKPDGSSIKIKQIRDLQKHLSFKIYEGRYKIIIFEEADKLTLQAANSLLKTLEDPLPQTVFILLADSQREMPDTILSRCQKIYFGEEFYDRDYLEIISIMEDVLNQDIEKTILIIDKLEKEDKENIKLKINGLMVIVRDLIVLKSTQENTLINATELPNSNLNKIAVNYEQLVKILEKLYTSLKNVDRNVNKRLLLENLFFTIKKCNL